MSPHALSISASPSDTATRRLHSLAHGTEFESASPVGATAYDRHFYGLTDVLVDERTSVQDVTIARTTSYGLTLFVDGAIQSSECDEYIYHEALVHPGMLLHQRPERVLVIGGGEGATLREVLRHDTVTHATMVDIDGRLVQLCFEHMPTWSDGAHEDPRTTLVIADGRTWLESSSETFDVILLDLTDQVDVGPSFPLYTQAFYRVIERHLSVGGIVVVQAGELSVGNYFSHCSIRKTLASVFSNVLSYSCSIPSFFSEWSWIVASHSSLADARDAKLVDARLAERVSGRLAFYDGAAHARLFTVTKNVSRVLDAAGTIVTTEALFTRAAAEVSAWSARTV